MPAYNENRDQNSFGFAGTTLRSKVSTYFVEGLAVTTSEKDLIVFDTAEMGGVNCSITFHNLATSASSIRIRGYVCNDNRRLPSNAGRITLANVYDETDASVSLPLTIAAGSTDHIVFGYKQQPQYTTFRYWIFTVDVAAGSATCHVYGCVK